MLLVNWPDFSLNGTSEVNQMRQRLIVLSQKVGDRPSLLFVNVLEASHARLNWGVDKVIIRSMRPHDHSFTETRTTEKAAQSHRDL